MDTKPNTTNDYMEMEMNLFCQKEKPICEKLLNEEQGSDDYEIIGSKSSTTIFNQEEQIPGSETQ